MQAIQTKICTKEKDVPLFPVFNCDVVQNPLYNKLIAQLVLVKMCYMVL